MKKTNRKCAVVLLMILLLTGCAAKMEEPAAQPTLPCPFYDAGIVRQHLSSRRTKDGAAVLFGAVVPHHAPFMQMVADTLSSVERDIDTVVVIAPNHDEIDEEVQVSGEGYYWPHGSICGAAALARTLLDDTALGAVQAGDVLITDHAASLQMPYIREAFPQAQVVTVFLKRTVTDAQLDTLAKLLLKEAENTELFVLASIDFSHGQNPEQTKVCDEEVREAVLRQDHQLLRSWDGAHLDAPHVLSVMLRLAQLRESSFTELDYVLNCFVENATVQGASYFSWGLE